MGFCYHPAKPKPKIRVSYHDLVRVAEHSLAVYKDLREFREYVTAAEHMGLTVSADHVRDVEDRFMSGIKPECRVTAVYASDGRSQELGGGRSGCVGMGAVLVPGAKERGRVLLTDCVRRYGWNVGSGGGTFHHPVLGLVLSARDGSMRLFSGPSRIFI